MFAGPNGSGKSTVTANFQALPNFPNNYANADEIADRVTLVGVKTRSAQKLSPV